MTIERTAWGLTDDGPVELITLTNAHGLVARTTTTERRWSSSAYRTDMGCLPTSCQSADD